MIRFTTASGTTYTLTDNNELTREGTKPLRHVDGGTLQGPKGCVVVFDQPPTVGESFFYTGPPPLYGCATTPVQNIEEVEQDG